MLEIVSKPKTEPQDVTRHPPLVPIRVVSVRQDRLRQVDQLGYMKDVEVGDILVILPGYISGSVLNATKKKMLESRYFENGALLCLRAYDVAQVVITNDKTPAPVT